VRGQRSPPPICCDHRLGTSSCYCLHHRDQQCIPAPVGMLLTTPVAHVACARLTSAGALQSSFNQALPTVSLSARRLTVPGQSCQTAGSWVALRPAPKGRPSPQGAKDTREGEAAYSEPSKLLLGPCRAAGRHCWSRPQHEVDRVLLSLSPFSPSEETGPDLSTPRCTNIKLSG
jgi:hypothetical protein